MGKKKGGTRLTKKQLAEQLQQLFISHPNETLSFKQIFGELHLTTHPAKMLAIDIMDEMAWDDFIAKVSETEYKYNCSQQIQEGTFIRKSNGKNSFQSDDGGKPIFVAERNSMFAMDGDRVRVEFMARKQNHIKECKVIEILHHSKDQFVGRLRVDKNIAYLVTEGSLLPIDIVIPRNKVKGGKTDDKAVVKITQWPDATQKTMIGEVVDILGQKGDNDAEMNSILVKYGLPYKYPEKVEKEADKISGEITEADLAEREDFRDVTTFTIDPHDAKDFDDALSIRVIERDRDGVAKKWEVGVHIADVSHYVKEGSIIDKEAQQRATSIYLVDRTIPMLPERLCNFVCSLRPDEEKLCYSVIFDLDPEAEIKSWRLKHTVIRSNRRFTYEEVQEILENNGVVDGTGQPAPQAGKGGYKGEFATELITLDALAKKLREKRFKNGAVKFDREELRFDVDEKGKPTNVYFKKSKDANKLIEEFMLLANRQVAESVGKVKKGKKAKTLPYRVHDNPDPQKLETLRNFIQRFGYKIKTEGTRGEISRSLNKLMDDCNGKAEQKLIETVALRAMMKAKYSTHNIGHYGLAFEYYTHFTSPIRRYPDTMVHRLLTKYQAGGRSANEKHYEELCEHSSDMELIATNAERESIKYKEVEFMEQFVGEEFDAHISGIASYGLYCEIDSNHCEGLVPIGDLEGDYYVFDEKNYQLFGRRTHRRYRLGDAIRIVVAAANLEKKQLDFALPRDDGQRPLTKAERKAARRAKKRK